MSPVSTEDAVAFRLPRAAVRRAFVLHSLLVGGVLVLAHLATRQAAWDAPAGGVLLGVAVLAASYAFTARRVWVDVSPAGLEATGSTGRSVSIPWSAPVRLKRARRGGQIGYQVVDVRHAGVLKSAVHAVFVPRAMARSAEFRDRLEAWAPATHPLRAVGSNAG